MIIVTGASGQLGSAVLDSLLERVPAEEVGVSVRDPQKLAVRQERGVRVRRGDYSDPASLEAAFEGASAVLVVSASSTGDEARRQHRNAIEAAAAAGVKRVVYTSHMGVGVASPFPPMPDHAAAEDVLRSAGVAFTSLRNGFYASTVPEAVDMGRVAEIASEITGRRIRRVVVSDEEYRQGLLSAGLPVAAADMLVGLFAASRLGDFGPADPALGKLLGRPLVTIEEYLRGSLAGG